MTRKEFLEQLDKELQDLNKEERVLALKYYEDYFADATDESEEEIIKKLGTPASVAESIKKDNIKNGTSFEKTKEKKKEPLSITAIILIALVLFTVGMPIIIAILSTVFGLLVGLIGIFIGLICAGIGIFISGVAVLTYGIITLFTSSAVGLLIMGIALILLGVGSILTLLSIKLCTIAIPNIIRGVVKICQIPFKNRGV